MTEDELMAMPEYAAVVDDPVSDLPRMRVADAIRATWPQRAELIELLVAERVEERRGEGRTPRAMELRRQSSPLLDAAYASVAATLPPEMKRTWTAVLRGFLEQLGLSIADFIRHGEQLVARYPLLSLQLEGEALDVSRLAEMPALGKLTSLRLRCKGLGDDGLLGLVTSRHLKNLRWLSTDSLGLTMRGYEHVVEATRTTLPNLEIFNSTYNQIDDPMEREPATDGYSGLPVYETVGILPLAGQVLEGNYGYQKILHWCSRFGPSMEKWPFD